MKVLKAFLLNKGTNILEESSIFPNEWRCAMNLTYTGSLFLICHWSC